MKSYSQEYLGNPQPNSVLLDEVHNIIPMWSREELQFCVKYPYSSRTKEIVRWLNFDLESLDPQVLERALQRAKEGIEIGVINPEVASRSQKILLVEILSYPVAKIIVSLTKDNYLINRYAHAEANTARRFLYRDDNGVVDGIATDVGINMHNRSVFFVDYLNNIPLQEQFKLVNAPLDKGRVTLTRESEIEMIAEVLRNNIIRDLKKRYDIPSIYSTYAKELKQGVSAEKAVISDEDLGPVDASLFPPCIKALLSRARAGENMAHQPRFVLATFLTSINMPIDQIISVFRNMPNFNEKKTRYYIEYSAGKRGSGVKYSPPACEKMKYYGLCVNPDALCSKVKHPLSYYAAKKKGKRYAKH
ncbi:MAG: DNA primase large subunit PriL [Candidatus Diapherotrites archaeon]|nr:DNA primase large subunit PriL [Candidatus Diapherotrites archaeon]